MSKGRVCLAYSGGLDTSTILVWLLNEGYTVVCYLANVGQEEDFTAVEEKALKLGAEAFVCEDLQRELVEEVVFKAIMCNAIFEDAYLLGTALARPVIARSQVRVAERHNCQYLSHGCTGKGQRLSNAGTNNFSSQVRFELAFMALNPSLKVIAPWRLPEFIQRFQGRTSLLKFAAENNIPVSSTPKAPWSMDDEDPDKTPPKELWTRTVDPVNAPNEPQEFAIHFENGIPIKVVTSDKEAVDSVDLFKLLNKIGHDHGVGRIDVRFIGLKSRVIANLVCSTPGLTLVRLAHLDLEGLVMDSRVRELRDQFVTLPWSRQLYQGMYFSPEREFVENSIVFSQRGVSGVVRMAAYRGNAYVLGRSSESSNLYSEQDASMDSLEGFSPVDTSGFIAIQGIRLKKFGLQKIKDGEPLSKS
ncbi:argininosuccinate synthase [Biscogniauxia marginata]|nr:argininosuccinate synthase [Biscogniauxia marginata]